MRSDKLKALLTAIVAAITQTSDRRAAAVIAGVGGKLGGAVAAAGLVGFIQTFGVAANGAAISGLYGAALNSATLYWIGSIFGLGAVAGGMILTGGGIVLAFILAFFLRRLLIGKPRKIETLEQAEKEIVYACALLLDAIPKDHSNAGLDKLELALIAQVALAPLAAKIETRLAAYFGTTLAVLPRRKLRRQLWKLGKIIKKHPMPKKQARGWRRLFSRSRSSA